MKLLFRNGSQKAQTSPCEAAHEQMMLLVYGELPDGSANSLEHHLSSCADCRSELQAVRGVAATMALHAVQEPSPNLLARTRIRLAEALDQAPRATWLMRWRRGVRANLNLVRTAPVAAAVLLFAGVGLGGYGGYLLHPGLLSPRPRPPPAAATPMIAEVNSVAQQPKSGLVKVDYEKLVPDSVQGSPDDPFIQKLLVAGTRNQVNGAVQNGAVRALADACSHGQACDQEDVRHALMVALRYDPDAAVRHKALSVLEPYVAEDTHVRDAVLESVLDDRDPGVRSAALGMLQPVRPDSSVQQVLHTVAAQDGNPHLRTVSREMLDGTPQIQ